jgi:murein DD-endopeptidase MepM/ murein hydrolase activator NlpD
LDVDCTVHGSLAPLANIRSDVAFRMHSKFRRHHKGTNFRAQSGTMVFAPTPGARQFVEHWQVASAKAPYGETDQSSQVVAMAQSIGTTFAALPLIYCANPPEAGKLVGVVIQHASVAVDFRKVPGWRRRIGRLAGWQTAAAGVKTDRAQTRPCQQPLPARHRPTQGAQPRTLPASPPSHAPARPS